MSVSLDSAIGAALAEIAGAQGEDGAWHVAYDGPLFLLPIYVITAEVVGARIEVSDVAEMRRYFATHQNGDGSFGLDVEGTGMLFPSVLVYAAWRLLGASPDDIPLRDARRWILSHGGLGAAAPWAKIILALLDVYDWRGVEPMPPEQWLLPSLLPVHPSRLWCHSRVILLPLSILWGQRAKQAPPLRDALRAELYCEPYDRMDWGSARATVAACDALVPPGRAYKPLMAVLRGYEAIHPRWLRKRAVARLMAHVEAEDRNTQYICLSPISKLLHTMVWHFQREGGDEVRAHVAQMPEYLNRGPAGVNMNGTISSRLWDTAFLAQAVALVPGRGEIVRPVLERAFAYLESNQMLVDTPDRRRYYRDASRGGWPFSHRDQGWPVADCTAEGLRAILAVEARTGQVLPEERILAAVDRILAWQNKDGGWPTYERARGPRWLEGLNGIQAFARVMIEYSYVECTSACVQALEAVRERLDPARARRMQRALARGARFMRADQGDDGSWLGSWGIAYTYGTWFGIAGLRASGAGPDDPAIQAAVGFLEARQRSDGAWGERPESALGHGYVEAADGQAVMTSWALLGLFAAGRGRGAAAARGISFLVAHQARDGRWPTEHLSAVFNRTCAIGSDNYRRMFPLMALVEYRQQVSSR